MIQYLRDTGAPAITAEVRRGDVEGQYAPFQVHNIKEHDVYEPRTKFRNSILLLSLSTT